MAKVIVTVATKTTATPTGIRPVGLRITLSNSDVYRFIDVTRGNQAEFTDVDPGTYDVGVYAVDSNNGRIGDIMQQVVTIDGTEGAAATYEQPVGMQVSVTPE